MREQERKKTSAILDQEMKAEKVEATLACTSAGKVTAASQAWHLSLLFDVIWAHVKSQDPPIGFDWFLGGFIVPFKDIQGKRLPFSHGRSKRQPKQGLWSAVKLDLARRGGFTSPLNAARSVGFDARCSPRSELPPGRDQTYDEVLLGVSCTLLKLGLWNFGFDLPSSWHGSNMDEASKHGSSCILWGSFLDWVDWAHFGRDIHGVVQRRM